MLQISDLEDNELFSDISNKESATVAGSGIEGALNYFLVTKLLPVPAEVRPILLANVFNILLDAAPPIGGIKSP